MFKLFFSVSSLTGLSLLEMIIESYPLRVSFPFSLVIITPLGYFVDFSACLYIYIVLIQ